MIRSFGAGPLFVATVLLLSGACGGGDATTSPKSPTTDETTTSPATASSTSTGAPNNAPSEAAKPAPSETGAPAAGAPPSTAPDGEELAFSTGGHGTLPASTVQKTLRQKMGAYAACYDGARTRAPGLKGRFAVHLRIEPVGAVSTVEVRGSKDETFSSCLADAIRALKFPKPKGGEVDVVYPLVFAEE